MTTALASPAVPASHLARPPAPSLATLTGLEIRKSLSTRSGKAARHRGRAARAARHPAGVDVGRPASLPPRSSWGSAGCSPRWSCSPSAFSRPRGSGATRASRTRSCSCRSAVGWWPPRSPRWPSWAWCSPPCRRGWPWPRCPRCRTSSRGTPPVGRVVTVIGAGAAFAVIGAGIGAAVGNAPAALTATYLTVLGVLPAVTAAKPAIGESLDPAAAIVTISQHGATATPDHGDRRLGRRRHDRGHRDHQAPLGGLTGARPDTRRWPFPYPGEGHRRVSCLRATVRRRASALDGGPAEAP